MCLTNRAFRLRDSEISISEPGARPPR